MGFIVEVSEGYLYRAARILLNVCRSEENHTSLGFCMFEIDDHAAPISLFLLWGQGDIIQVVDIRGLKRY